MHDHAHIAIQTASLWPVMTSMFLTGVVGGFGHCTSMCGPFVLAQVVGGIAGRDGAAGPVLARAGGGVLLPYHLGRIVTYGGLGALAGGVSGLVVAATEFKWLLAAFLAVAALLFLAQAMKGFARWFPALRGLMPAAGHGPRWTDRIGQALARPLRPLLADPRGLNGFLVGLALGFLPCGFLYAALASAVGVGSAGGGFLVMAAFALGTVPSLVTVGVLGSVAGANWLAAMRALAPVLMLVNAAILAGFAWHAIAG